MHRGKNHAPVHTLAFRVPESSRQRPELSSHEVEDDNPEQRHSGDDCHPLRVGFCDRNPRRWTQPTVQEPIHVVRHREETHDEARQQIADQQSQPQWQLQRRQGQSEQDDSRVETDPDRDRGFCLRRWRGPRFRSRRRQTNCRTNCPRFAVRSRGTCDLSARSCCRSGEVSHVSRWAALSKRYSRVHSSCTPSTGRNSYGAAESVESTLHLAKAVLPGKELVDAVVTDSVASLRRSAMGPEA